MAHDLLQAIALDIRSDLARVEEGLKAAIDSSEPLVREPALHLLEAGGKRFRPMLVLLAGHLGDSTDARLVPCAVAIELMHLATLYHDDVIDESLVRRGVSSANAAFDNRIAILAGDYLFARSSGIAADLGPFVSRILADTIAELCEGQIIEGGDAQTTEHYLSVIDRKTASLIAASCRLGAWLAGAPEEVVQAATRYGRALGMAFQLSDDVLDIAGIEEQSGKVPGTDLREGVHTLPVLETLAGRAEGSEALREALGHNLIDRALEVLRSNGSIALAKGVVAEWSRRAKVALAPAPRGAGRDALEQLADFVVDRTG
ncbi:MAG: polyprenyl synthetase family protein [Actinomycetota bacterium]|nr:polyprenyl synthetase family protein [Actinomycetota bacterium]